MPSPGSWVGDARGGPSGDGRGRTTKWHLESALSCGHSHSARAGSHVPKPAPRWPSSFPLPSAQPSPDPTMRLPGLAGGAVPALGPHCGAPAGLLQGPLSASGSLWSGWEKRLKGMVVPRAAHPQDPGGGERVGGRQPSQEVTLMGPGLAGAAVVPPESPRAHVLGLGQRGATAGKRPEQTGPGMGHGKGSRTSSPSPRPTPKGRGRGGTSGRSTSSRQPWPRSLPAPNPRRVASAFRNVLSVAGAAKEDGRGPRSGGPGRWPAALTLSWRRSASLVDAAVRPWWACASGGVGERPGLWPVSQAPTQGPELGSLKSLFYKDSLPEDSRRARNHGRGWSRKTLAPLRT